MEDKELHEPAVMNMTPAARLILAFVDSDMLVIFRQLREKSEVSTPITHRTTPTIIRARTAWKEPVGGRKRRSVSEASDEDVMAPPEAAELQFKLEFH